MPVVTRTNNRILPANQRAADVAEKAVSEILPTQQQRYLAAFRVQGFNVIQYLRLQQGRVCSCHGKGKILNTKLGLDGKADQGTINEMLTQGMEFSITGYGQSDDRRLKQGGKTSPFAPVNKDQGGDMHLMSFGDEGEQEEFPGAVFPSAEEGGGFGANGPSFNESLDDLVLDYDASLVGMGDSACPVCFGTGFIGGYYAFRGHRLVLAAQDLVMSADGGLNYEKTPFSGSASYVQALVVFPRGALDVEAMRLWNYTTILPIQVWVDGQLLAHRQQLLYFCDGKQHLVKVALVPGTEAARIAENQLMEFTHLELQFRLSNESSYFEFPKMSSSSDTALLDQTNPFSIVISPDIPLVQPGDVLKETVYGRTLLVKNTNDWNTRQRNVLGWEAEVRVLQPQELGRILPERGKTAQKSRTTNAVRDNGSGTYRT